ncbi:MAG: hypothetical protein ABSG68_12375 [Thermoguttaceae bacterium]|jgi:hypothetical protein
MQAVWKRATRPVGFVALAVFSSITILPVAAAVAAEDTWQALVAPDNSLSLNFLHRQTAVFRLGLGGWGPNWSWVGLSSQDKAQGDKLTIQIPFVVNRASGQVIDIKFQAWKSGPRQLCFRYDLSAARDVPLTMLMAGLAVEKPMAKGKIVLWHVDGKQTALDLPLRIGAAPAAKKAIVVLKGMEPIALDFEPPCAIAFDNDLRIMLAGEVFRRGARSTTITVTLSDDVALLARQADVDRLTKTLAGPDWFPFHCNDDPAPGVIGMNDWLERPAGKHGGVRMAGDQFQFADGTPVKFWGVNLSYGGGCAPEKKDGRFTAARFAKYGVNGVRLHKFTYPKDQMGIGDPQDATRMDPEGLDRLDCFAAELKKQGIYFGWSHTYRFHVCPGNRARLAAYGEIEKNLHGDTYGFMNFAEDVQDLVIEMVVNLLGHKNPYTGRTYAEEPALSYIEMQNEDDIFFYTSTAAFNACPTYHKIFLRQFAQWLKTKYGSQAALAAAWHDALAAGESLAAQNIEPQTNPWFFGDGQLPNTANGQRQRLLDTAAYLHHLQNTFYAKFQRAVRAAGYQGPLVGSPWQAPAMLPHYYNLRSDYLAGYIDRHNYFGEKLLDSMLAQPGSGYFSSGLQQVIDRPFGLSEWIHVYPSLYSAEGPAIIAAYGLGLQGWDASYQFQSQSTRRTFNDRAGWLPWGVWEADVPTQLGQYPALSRMVQRGDVKQAEVISVRRVSPAELLAGRFSFADTVAQQGDVKTFGGSVPPEALAAGRVVVEFTERPQASTFPRMEQYRRGTAIVSTTKQLAWDTAGGGSFVVNTPGTKALVGFAQDRPFALGEVTIRCDCPYASLFLTALEPKATLRDTRHALLTAVARNCNTGFKYFALDGRVLDNGTAPLLLEPVKATITIAGRPIRSVNVLDHDGRRTGKTLSFGDGSFSIDGARDRTMYYEVMFQ